MPSGTFQAADDGAHDRFSLLVESRIGAPLIEAGFRPSGRIWSKSLGSEGVVAAIGVQRSVRRERRIVFTVNWGITADRWRDPHLKLRPETCAHEGRIGAFLEDPWDLWWSVGPEDVAYDNWNEARQGPPNRSPEGQLESLIRSGVVPHLDHLRTPDDIAAAEASGMASGYDLP